MAEPLPTYSSLLVQISPPWLQRLVGERFLSALGAPIDTAYERARESIKQRFPLVVDDSSLAMVGRERRIRRGPAEDATTYARRLRTWWDAHRTRGGPYALLHQLDAFFEDWLNVRMDVVYYSGTRRWIDENSVITRDSITWTANGKVEGPAFAFAANVTPGAESIYLGAHSDLFPDYGPYNVRVWDGDDPTGEIVSVLRQTPDGYLLLAAPVVGGTYGAGAGRVAREDIRWAHVWVFFYCPELIPGADRFLITDDGDTLITDDGDTLVAESTIAVGAITDAEKAIFTAIPREWSAAHIPYVTVVLLYGIGELWEYPQPVGTWDEWEAAGGTFDSDLPQVLIAE